MKLWIISNKMVYCNIFILDFSLFVALSSVCVREREREFVCVHVCYQAATDENLQDV